MTTSPTICVYPADENTDTYQLADSARRASINAIHLPWSVLQRHLESNADVAALTTEALAYGVPVSGVDATPLTAERDYDLAGQLDRIEVQMQAAARLGLSAVSIMGGARNAVAEQYLIAGLTSLVPRGQRLGLDICLRNRHGTVLEQIIDVHGVCAAVDGQNLKLDLDVAEFHESCVNPCEPVLAFQRRIAKIRLSDVRAARPVSLGCGEINAAAVADALRHARFSGLILLRLGSDAAATDRLQADRRFLHATGLAIQ